MSEYEPHEEHELLAAEYVLGLLTAEEMLSARGRVARDAQFAALVEAWERRFAPLYQGFAEVRPDTKVWAGIGHALDGERRGGAEVVKVIRAERWWKGYSAAMTAVAASLALVLVFQVMQPDQPSREPATQQPTALVASLASDDGSTALAVAFEVRTRSMIVTPARLVGAAGRDHELWLIPAGGAPVSLGLVRGNAPARRPVPEALLAAVGPQATVALSLEPPGGSPTGSPTGQVIASGVLTRI